MANVKNFAIDHVLRGIMTKRNGEYMWSINQISNPSLSVTTENAQAVDALGSVMVEFDRGRNAEFSAENSLFDLGLYAAQMGKDVEVASADAKMVVPAFEEIAGGVAEVALKHTPVGEIAKIYKMNGDGSLGVAYELGTAASETEFVYADGKITLPTGLTANDTVFVMYEYESENATGVTADAINFPKAGKFVMEVLGTDVCDPDTLIHAYVIFPNAKLDGNVDYSFTTDGTHPSTWAA